jgi:hypothetical protein
MVYPNFSIFSFASMVYPTFTMLAYAAVVAAVLIAADWYVWGRTYANDFRTPRTVKPQSDVVERILGRVIAVNEVRVPLTGMNPVTATAASVSAEDDGHGFRKVA